MNNWEMEGKPALLVMHMQHGIVGGGSDSSPEYIKPIKDSGIILRQKALLNAFRNKKLPVIYVNALDRPPVNIPLPAYGFLWNHLKSIPSNPKYKDIIPELAPQPEEPNLINWPLGAFNNSGLDQTLKANNIQTLVLVGFMTDGVILSAIQYAADLYYSVIIPNDATNSPSVEAHKAVMEIIAPAVALVTTSEDVIAHL
jgi:nicotinamidase-related amidase